MCKLIYKLRAATNPRTQCCSESHNLKTWPWCAFFERERHPCIARKVPFQCISLPVLCAIHFHVYARNMPKSKDARNQIFHHFNFFITRCCGTIFFFYDFNVIISRIKKLFSYKNIFKKILHACTRNHHTSITSLGRGGG